MKMFYKIFIGILLLLGLFWILFTPKITYLIVENPANNIVYQDSYVTIRGQYSFDEAIKKMRLKFTIDKKGRYEGDLVNNDSAKLIFSVDVYDTIPKIRKSGYGVGYEEIIPVKIYLDNELQKNLDVQQKWKQKILEYEVATNNEAPKELKLMIYSCIRLGSESMGTLWSDGRDKEAFMEKYSQVYNGKLQEGFGFGCFPLEFTLRRSIVISFWKIRAWQIL